MKKSKRVKKSNSWKIKQHRDPFFKKSKTFIDPNLLLASVSMKKYK